MNDRQWAAPADVAGHVARVWIRRGTGPVPLALPVPAVDLLVLGDGSVLVAGPELSARRGDLPPGGVLAGFPLRPGSCTALLGVSAADVPAAGVPLDDLVRLRRGRQARDPVARGLATLRMLAARSDRSPDDDVLRAVDLMRERPGESVGAYATAVGLSERQLRRRFTAAVGLAPKPYMRVRRLHAVLAAARSGAPRSWATLAADAGFYDQPHMLAEFRRSVGCAPDALMAVEDGRFLHDRRPAGGQGHHRGRQPR